MIRFCVDRGDFDREDEDPEYKPTRLPFKDDIDVRTYSCFSTYGIFGAQ